MERQAGNAVGITIYAAFGRIAKHTVYSRTKQEHCQGWNHQGKATLAEIAALPRFFVRRFFLLCRFFASLAERCFSNATP
jgi:hypothetical protein